MSEQWSKEGARKEAQELTDLSIEHESFPRGRQLCVILNVVNPEKTWMLLESLVDKDGEKLVAGCHVRHIRMVARPEPLNGSYRMYHVGVHGDSERVEAMNEALKTVGSEPSVTIWDM